MARLDYFYVDNDFAKYSLVKLDGYETFSETLKRKSPGYKLDTKTLYIVPDTDHRVNLDEFFALMRSKDIAAYERDKDKFFGPSGRFTTENAIEQMSVLYATFPRSGNSMMRKYFENVCGLATGSDLQLKHGLNTALQHCVSKGEGQMGPATWIKKTHYPFVMPFQKKHEHDIVIICARYEVNC